MMSLKMGLHFNIDFFFQITVLLHTNYRNIKRFEVLYSLNPGHVILQIPPHEVPEIVKTIIRKDCRIDLLPGCFLLNEDGNEFVASVRHVPSWILVVVETFEG